MPLKPPLWGGLEGLITGVAQLVEHWSPKPGVGSSSLSARANFYFYMKIINYIKEAYTELVQKVSWPSRSELTNSAIVVLIASIILALIVWLMDLGFETIMTFIYDKLR
jgi:preprotein translocase subunit SecE